MGLRRAEPLPPLSTERPKGAVRWRKRAGTEKDFVVYASKHPGLEPKLAAISVWQGKTRHHLVIQILQEYVQRVWPDVPEDFRELAARTKEARKYEEV